MQEFDRYAADYAAGMENPLKRLAGADAEVFIELKAHHLAEDLAERPLRGMHGPLRLLDFGCGEGVLLRLLAQSGFVATLTGCDVSQGMLEEAGRKWAAASWNGGQPPPVSWRVSEPGRLPFADCSFDVVTCLGVFHHIPPAHRDAEHAELARVLRPGGRCYIYEHNPLNPLTRLVVSRTAIDANAVLLNHWEAVQGFRRHGFRVHLSHGLMYFPPRWRWSWRFERFVRWLPFGGQYVVAGEKP
jgi:SAM-dependent methyltransferase